MAINYWTLSEENRPIRATGMVVAPREALPRNPNGKIDRNLLRTTFQPGQGQ